MNWDDVATIERNLYEALAKFNWSKAAALCTELIERIRTSSTPFPESSAKSLLNRLRRKRQFQQMARLAEVLMQSGMRSPQIRRQYAQALIDQGILTAPELVLQTIIQDSQGHIGEETEAHGLLGRIYKQLYVNINDSSSPANRINLERALAEYLYVYRLSPEENLWPGINLVALLDRARRDNVSLQGLPDPCQLARDILAMLEKRARKATEAIPAWDIGTELEALVALGRDHEAEVKALEYSNCDGADAFEIASTLRQLTEVWQLNDQESPGSKLLPILRAALLSREAGAVGLAPDKIQQEIQSVDKARHDLEKTFGPDKTQTLKWYQTGLNRCQSIARVERVDGKAFGTGWLVKGNDFFPKHDGGLLLLTNAHVLSIGEPRALKPNNAQINFQVLGQRYEVDQIVWSSPAKELDATLVSLKGDRSKLVPIPLNPEPIEIDDPPPRMYVIGHPGGRDLEFSLQDNYLLACNDRLVHYRSPTEPGSSGSPVFEPLDWKVAALHHAGKYQMDRIDGIEGTYEANEGISVLAIQKATRREPD